MKRLIYIVCALVLAAFIEAEAWAGSATLTWTAPTQYTDNSTIQAGDLTAYVIEYGRCAGADRPYPGLSLTVIVDPSLTTYTVTNVPDGVGHCFRVKAVAFGTAVSEPSNVGFKQPVAVVPAPPVVTFNGTTGLSWTAPTLNTDGSTIPGSGAQALTSYNIEWFQCSSPSVGWPTLSQSATVSAATTTYTMTGMLAGVGYCMRVRAVNAAGAMSDTSNVTNRPAP